MNLEDELRSALRRENPSPGFAGRVAARTRTQAKSRWAFPRLVWATAIAALLVIGFGALTGYRQKQAERASQDAVLALRITAEKLNLARDKALRLTEN